MVAMCLAIAAVAAMAGGEIEKVDVAGIENFSRLSGSSGFAGALVGFGGATLPSAMAELKSAGFTTVMNLRLASEEGIDIEASLAAAEAAGLQYINLPLDTDEPDLAVVDDFLTAVGNKANQPVYIHCNSATRAAALWMIGRVLKDGWEIEAASKEVEVISPKPSDAIAFAKLYIASKNTPEPLPE